MLYGYQIDGMETLEKYESYAYLGDEMGLGKTAQALGVADTRANTLLVVAPAATLSGWNAEALRLGLQPLSLWTKGPVARRTLISWSRAKAFALAHPDYRVDMLVTDETHYAKNYKAARTKAVLGSWYKGKHKAGIVDRAKFWLALSGTPMPNRPIELFPLLGAMYARKPVPDLRCATNWQWYAENFCNLKRRRLGKRVVWDDTGASNLPRLRQILDTHGHMVRRLKADVLKELPPVVQRSVSIGRGPEWDGDVGLIKAALAEGRTFGDASLLEWRKDLALAKCERIAEYCKEILAETDHCRGLVVYMHHRDAVAKVAQLLDTPFAVTGDTPPNRRQDLVREFAHGSHRVFVAGFQAVGTGINGLQHKSDICVFGETPWVPGEVAQAIGRLHRIGQEGSVDAHFLVADGLDEYILSSVLRKERTVAEVIR